MCRKLTRQTGVALAQVPGAARWQRVWEQSLRRSHVSFVSGEETIFGKKKSHDFDHDVCGGAEERARGVSWRAKMGVK